MTFLAFIFTSLEWDDYFIAFGGVFVVGLTIGSMIKFFRAGS